MHNLSRKTTETRSEKSVSLKEKSFIYQRNANERDSLRTNTSRNFLPEIKGEKNLSAVKLVNFVYDFSF